MKYQRIKDMREDTDKKQDELALYLKITKQQYSLYETGKREFPFHMIIKLSIFYNVSIDYLAGLINEPKKLYDNK